MPVTKIVSGGQVGSDRSGLRAGRRLGLETGGYAPKGWKTKDGPSPDLGRIFNLKEHSSPDYPPRTEANVLNSDATVRFAKNFNSPGEKCTLKFLLKHRKPYFNVHIPDEMHEGKIQEFRKFLVEHQVETLNVAGNADSEIENMVESFLVRALTPPTPPRSGKPV